MSTERKDISKLCNANLLPIPNPLNKLLKTSLLTTLPTCLALLDPVKRNWFRISQRVTMVAIGLQKLNAKSESDANLLMYDVY